MSDGAPGGVVGNAPAREFAEAPSDAELTSEPPAPTPTTKTTRRVISRASTPPTRSGDRRSRCGTVTQPVDAGEIGWGRGAPPGGGAQAAPGGGGATYGVGGDQPGGSGREAPLGGGVHCQP